MAHNLYVGADLHKTQFTVSIIDENEDIENGVKYPVSDEGFSSFACHINDLSASYTDEIHIDIAIESTGNARYFRDRMQAFGFTVQIVNTLKFKVVNISSNKTDTNDAHILAEFLRSNMLPKSHLCSAENESLRRLIKTRSLLVADSVAIKNQVHAELLSHGYLTSTAQFQSRKSREMVIESVGNDVQNVVKSLFKTLESVEKITSTIDRDLKSISENDAVIKNLMTVPGIGIVNACIIKAYTDDVSRFGSYKKYAAYCGLVPWVQSSNESSYYGHITKRGPKELRTAFVQTTVAMVRMSEKTKSYSIMKDYKNLKDNKCSGKAIIATARKISRIVYTMMCNNSSFDAARLTK